MAGRWRNDLLLVHKGCTGSRCDNGGGFDNGRDFEFGAERADGKEMGFGCG